MTETPLTVQDLIPYPYDKDQCDITLVMEWAFRHNIAGLPEEVSVYGASRGWSSRMFVCQIQPSPGYTLELLGQEGIWHKATEAILGSPMQPFCRELGEPLSDERDTRVRCELAKSAVPFAVPIEHLVPVEDSFRLPVWLTFSRELCVKRVQFTKEGKVRVVRRSAAPFQHIKLPRSRGPEYSLADIVRAMP